MQVVSLPQGEVSGRQKTVVEVVSPEGEVVDAPQGPGTLGKVRIANKGEIVPAFTLADLKDRTLYLPGDGKYYGSRIYLSIHKPLNLKVNDTADGYIQPNVENASDLDYATPFDWFEFTYDAARQEGDSNQNKVAFGGNVTQVDVFSIPMSFTVKGVNGTRIQRGITLGKGSSSGVNSRAELIQKYMGDTTMGEPFKKLAQSVNGEVVRLIAPYHSPVFKTGGAGESHFDGYVDSVWNAYKYQTLVAYDQPGSQGNQYKGHVITRNGKEVFEVTRNGGSAFYLSKPSTYDVLTNNGAFQPGSDDANAFGAQLAAALNRHVAADPASWHVPANFYPAGQQPANDWGKFWHSVSIERLAYGFGFDDVSDQSSVVVLPSTEDVSSLTLSVGW